MSDTTLRWLSREIYRLAQNMRPAFTGPVIFQFEGEAERVIDGNPEYDTIIVHLPQPLMSLPISQSQQACRRIAYRVAWALPGETLAC